MAEKPYHMLYPVRVVLVSSGHAGKDNVMSAAWCFPLSADPPLFGVSLSRKRLTHSLVEKSGEFVINIPGDNLLGAVEACGTNSGRDTDKWALAGLTREKSAAVSAPSIAECLASIECRVKEAVEAGDHVMFIGEAVNIKTRKKGKGIYQAPGKGLAIL